MTATPTALWWARARSRGPVRQDIGTAAPDGFLRLLEPDASAVWLLPALPDAAGPATLAELGIAGPVVEQPNDTARVLGIIVRCCWPDVDGPVWPGAPAPFGAVTSVFRDVSDRDEDAVHRACLAAVRRLHAAGWVLWDEPGWRVRVGPRAAGWGPADLTVLRQLCRQLPGPPADLPAGRPLTGPADDDPGDPDPGDAVRAAPGEYPGSGR